jgi:predicted nucleic acid-binding protein
MIVVSDASPIINLSIIGRLDLLHKLFDSIVIPRSVYDEIAVQGKTLPGSREIKNSKYFKILKAKDKTLLNSLENLLDKGEAEAIVLAIEIKADLILMDETRGRKISEQFNLRPLGLLGVLVEAKNREFIKNLKPLLDELITNAGFWISKTLYKKVLTSVEEDI